MVCVHHLPSGKSCKSISWDQDLGRCPALPQCMASLRPPSRQSKPQGLVCVTTLPPTHPKPQHRPCRVGQWTRTARVSDQSPLGGSVRHRAHRSRLYPRIPHAAVEHPPTAIPAVVALRRLRWGGGCTRVRGSTRGPSPGWGGVGCGSPPPGPLPLLGRHGPAGRFPRPSASTLSPGGHHRPRWVAIGWPHPPPRQGWGPGPRGGQSLRTHHPSPCGEAGCGWASACPGTHPSLPCGGGAAHAQRAGSGRRWGGQPPSGPSAATRVDAHAQCPWLALVARAFLVGSAFGGLRSHRAGWVLPDARRNWRWRAAGPHSHHRPQGRGMCLAAVSSPHVRFVPYPPLLALPAAGTLPHSTGAAYTLSSFIALTCTLGFTDERRQTAEDGGRCSQPGTGLHGGHHSSTCRCPVCSL